MKKFFIFLFIGLFIAGALCSDVSAAKKASKLSNEAIEQMNNDIDYLTKKIYARALLSPQDNETLIGIKIQLDNQMLMSSATEMAPLYYKAANVYMLRGMEKEAIDCYKTILENFSDTALAPKARTALEDLGIEVAAPKVTDEEEEEGI